jgi:hypothetical protein
MTPKDTRMMRLLAILGVATTLMAIGGGVIGTSRALGVALLIVGFAILQATWIPVVQRRKNSRTRRGETVSR